MIRSILLLSGAALCVALAVFVLSLRATVTKVNLELDEAHRVTLEAGLTAMEARKASVLEEQALTNWNTQVSQILKSASVTLASVKATSDQATETERELTASVNTTLQDTDQTIIGLQPSEQQAALAIASVNQSAQSIDRLVSDPEIMATIGHIDVTSGEFAQTSTDFQNKFHAILFPPPCKGRWCFVVKAWPYVKAASSLAEPAYWASEIYRH